MLPADKTARAVKGIIYFYFKFNTHYFSRFEQVQTSTNNNKYEHLQTFTFIVLVR